MSNREFILSVIEKYRNTPCLWQVTHKDYRDKIKRNEALKELLILFKARDKQSNLDTVKKRIVSLRSSFMKELNKVRKSIETKSESDDIHVPKLWYYNEMTFLIDVCPPRAPSPSPQGDQEIVIVKEDNDNAEITDEENQFDDAPSSPVSSNKSYPALPITHIKRKPSQAQIHYPLAKTPRRTDLSSSLPSSSLKYAAYGEHIAEKLRSMPDIMATYCQKLINDAIFLAETNNLDMHSQIMNNEQF